MVLEVHLFIYHSLFYNSDFKQVRCQHFDKGYALFMKVVLGPEIPQSTVHSKVLLSEAAIFHLNDGDGTNVV